jgi:hypothetical protein
VLVTSSCHPTAAPVAERLASTPPRCGGQAFLFHLVGFLQGASSPRLGQSWRTSYRHHADAVGPGVVAAWSDDDGSSTRHRVAPGTNARSPSPAATSCSPPWSTPRRERPTPRRSQRCGTNPEVGAGCPLGLYSAERYPIDVVRLRHLKGSDVAWEALRHWLGNPGRSPPQLIELAREFPRAEPALR